MSASRDLKERKRALRAEVLALRDAIPRAERTRRSESIAERLLRLPALAAATTVMVFSSFGSEVQTDPIIERLTGRGARILLPRVVDGQIHAVAYAPGDALAVAAFGAREPLEGDPVEPLEIDVVVVPAVAFDRRGNRIGYGGGFYDRFLRRTRPGAAKVGICFAVQVVEEVPHGNTDLPVTRIVTDEAVIECL